MDSYHFHFERMSNLDLHPLSLPVSRLSPAKSTSSIDQFTHHHGKGDSAYSSFSGGSSAPDYPSTFFPDDLQHHSLHYADLKYVKAIYHPSALDSDSKSMDQLYRSVEAISNQYRQNRHSVGSLGAGQFPNQNPKMPPPPPPPPPPPARMDSFIATRNLENCRAQHSPRANPSAACLRSDLAYGRRASQPYRRDTFHPEENTAQQQSADLLSPSTPRTGHHEQRPKQHSVGGGHSGGQHKRVHSAHRSLMPEPPRSASPWHVAQNMVNSSIQHKGQFYFVTGVCKSSESVPKHGSVCVSEVGRESPVPVEGSHCTVDTLFRNTQQRNHNTPNTMTTDDREFYTKSQDVKSRNLDEEKPAQRRISYATSHISNHAPHSFDDLEQSHNVQSREIGRQHSSNHHIFYCGPENCIPSSNSHNQDLSQVSHFPILSKSFDQLDQLCNRQAGPGADQEMRNVAFSAGGQGMEKAQGQTKRKPLFKQDSAPQLGTESVPPASPPGSPEQAAHCQRDESAEGGRKPLFGDLAREKINKETTPLLYHLTGANREALGLYKPRKENEVGGISKDGFRAAQKDTSESCGGETPLAGTSKEEREDVSHPCNTLDNSFKKYYKEKLKDAQSKVLRETSFKRKDLQLSWPHRVKPRPGPRPTVLHTVSSSQDSENPAGTLAPSPTHSEGTRRENVPQMVEATGMEIESELVRESQTESGRPLNVAQPQVARVGARRRLTPEQKKLCYSEPEKLNQLGDTPYKHAACHSLDTEREQGRLELSSEEGDLGEQGLVAARRKMFETRGRALSTSSLSKTSLKHLQHKALVAYMERKMGHKVAEPWQPVPQAPPAPPATQSPSLRHSASVRTSDSSPRPQSRNKGPKKKLHRPHSAGRILDSTSSSISCQTPRPVDESVVVQGGQAVSEPEDQGLRVAAQRGKSLEELGVSQDSQPPVLSRNSKKPLLKRDSAPQLGSREDSGRTTESTTGSGASVHPETSTSSWGRALSVGSSGSYDFGPLVKDEVNALPCVVIPPQPPTSQESSEREVRSSSTSPSTPVHLRGAGSGSSRGKTVPPLQHPMEREESVDEPSESLQAESSQEVSLSCGVTTDPAMWALPTVSGREDGAKSPALSDDLAEGEAPPPDPVPADPPPTSGTTPVLGTDARLSEESGPPGEDKDTKMGGEMPAGETEEVSAEKTLGAKEPGWEDLVMEVVTADQSLARVLYPLTNRKTALMLMEQLLSEDTLLMEEHYKKKQETRGGSGMLHTADSSETVEDAEASPTSPDDAIAQLQPGPLNKMEVTEKKKLLVACIEERLRALEEPRGALRTELQENGKRGEAVEALVRELCTPAELERYGLFVGDLERVVSLLLCLSARLARVQNALSTVDQHTDAEEKDSLDNRHSLLCKQREDAKDLKDNLDRRERMVSNFLSRCLTAEQLQEYRRFIQTKASLLIRMKDLDERQRLGEEQLESLLNTLPS
ncbi:protein Shroom1 isoform X2 [Esox lucius]|uniref:Shroom family member 1 n=1 Tax=Esox lucius TaxID=8010 RepID=A0A3P8Z9T7_ESOLU|nr:protein Shroom1 isoform X2 [Esox lucius]